jgi:DNA-binding transcriptional LysR family regulator
MDRVSQMEAFVAVVDEGSFVAAARRLGLSTAAISRQVSALEDRLSTRLLNRTTRRLSLTDEGRNFYSSAQGVLSELAQAEEEVTAGHIEASGRLRINAPVSFGLLRLAPLWPQFLDEHPDVELDITLSDRLVDLIDEGYDMAVRIGQLQSSSLVSRRMGATRLCLCASPEYLEAHGRPEHPDELAQHQIISYSLFSSGTRWQFQGAHGEESVRITPRMHSNSGDTCVTAAIAGHGIILQPDFLVDDALASGRLVELLPRFQGRTLSIYLVYPGRRNIPRKTRAMIDFLIEHLRNLPPG